MKLPPPTSRAVLSAAYEVHRRRDHWPTVEELAIYLEAEVADVERELRELHRERILRRRQRQGRKVWMPWGAP